MSNIDKTKLSPMMQIYMQTKEEYKDCILFYRLGDFYEMFFDDALIASKELELTLTGKECGLEERAPMCGVPHHAVDSYITKLVNKGYKVAIGEQVEDPKMAKGLVKREVIKVVTPGTNLAVDSLTEDVKSYILAISNDERRGKFGLAFVELSTGEFRTSSVDSFVQVKDEITRFLPKEIIYDDSFGTVFDEEFRYICDKNNISLTLAKDNYIGFERCADRIKKHFHVGSLEGLGLKDFPESVMASGVVLAYLYDTQKDTLSYIDHIEMYFTKNFMILDSATRRNLELTETMRDKQKKGSLLHVLDKTKTAMGARLLRDFVTQPLVVKTDIEDRLDAISVLKENYFEREELREYLNAVYDLERLLTRICIRTANPRDLIAFKSSLRYLPDIKAQLTKLTDAKIFKNIYDDFDVLDDLYKLIDDAIVEEPPISVKEGGIFKQGYSADMDDLKNAEEMGDTWLIELEQRERDKTGIKSLKVKYNKVFGYYIEVTNSFKNMVPDYFVRKQTLVNAERYMTDELSEISGKILGSKDKLYNLEYEEFVNLRQQLADQSDRIKKTAHYLANIDVFCSLCLVADRNNYVRPEINDNGVIDIKDGRHPVIEEVIGTENFVTNDTVLDNETNRISIITGPNMAGKSTYMRQTALICLMAQLGSYVPAGYANICLSDRIFTRVGASDDLASGQSTFMVEMNEVANILRNATGSSLVILDEIGRGTSTYDGLSIAWAVVEYIADKNLIGAKTLFATHYHELTELEGKLPAVHNFNIAIKEEGKDIVFLRKIVNGGADRSYGIEVARLAGVPEEALERAREICDTLVQSENTQIVKEIKVGTPRKKKEDFTQLSFFEDPKMLDITNELKSLDLNDMTPMKALLYLQELKDRLN